MNTEAAMPRLDNLGFRDVGLLLLSAVKKKSVVKEAAIGFIVKFKNIMDSFEESANLGPQNGRHIRRMNSLP